MGFLPDDAVCLVTGANSGIGRAAARELGRRGYRVVLACRDPARGEEAVERLQIETDNPHLELRLVDLADQASIRRLGAELRRDLPALHLLVNNAGVWMPERRLTSDGVETTWAVNQLGYFLLTEELRPLLEGAGRARVVSVASELAGGLDLEDVDFERRLYDGVRAYAQSKQANRMWTRALARRLEGTGVEAFAVHPGLVHTGITRRQPGVLGGLARLLFRVLGRGPEAGARAVLRAADDPELSGRSGAYLTDRRELRCRYADPPREEALWALCAARTGRASTPPAAPGR